MLETDIHIMIVHIRLFTCHWKNANKNRVTKMLSSATYSYQCFQRTLLCKTAVCSSKMHLKAAVVAPVRCSWQGIDTIRQVITRINKGSQNILMQFYYYHFRLLGRQPGQAIQRYANKVFHRINHVLSNNTFQHYI